MQEAVDAALDEARRAGASRVHRVRLRIGRLAGVEAEALPLAFEVACAGTPAEGAALEVEDVAVRCRCPSCDEDFVPAGMVFACPGCGALSSDVRAGRELELAQVEVS